MPSVDPLLAKLVTDLENLGADGKAIPHIDIALTVGGMIVMGELCTAQAFAEASTGIVKRAHHASEDTILSLVVALDLSLSMLPGGPPHIHLKRVEFRVPGGTGEPENSTEYWRAPLDRIDGFCLTGQSL